MTFVLDHDAVEVSERDHRSPIRTTLDRASRWTRHTQAPAVERDAIQPHTPQDVVESVVDTLNRARHATSAAAWNLVQRRILQDAPINQPGSLPHPGRPAGQPQPDLTPDLAGIDYIFIFTVENQSFDGVFGQLPVVDPTKQDVKGFPERDADGRPTATNQDLDGNWHRATLKEGFGQHYEQPHQTWGASHGAIGDDGAMDGFARVSDPVAMQYHDNTTLPYLYQLGHHYALSDAHFAFAPSQTQPNRLAQWAATTAGYVDTAYHLRFPKLPGGHIFQHLDEYGITHRNYFTSVPSPALVSPWYTAKHYWKNFRGPGIDSRRTNRMFQRDIARGDIASVTTFDYNFRTESMEPPQHEGAAEQALKETIDIIQSDREIWEHCVIVINFDEHGGSYDHVRPPVRIPAGDGSHPDVEAEELHDDDDTMRGPRVPCLVISPFARPGYTSHDITDQAAVSALIEEKWNLPRMTYADANEPGSLRDMLDPNGAMHFKDPVPMDPLPYVSRSEMVRTIRHAPGTPEGEPKWSKGSLTLIAAGIEIAREQFLRRVHTDKRAA